MTTITVPGRVGQDTPLEDLAKAAATVPAHLRHHLLFASVGGEQAVQRPGGAGEPGERQVAPGAGTARVEGTGAEPSREALIRAALEQRRARRESKKKKGGSHQSAEERAAAEARAQAVAAELIREEETRAAAAAKAGAAKQKRKAQIRRRRDRELEASRASDPDAEAMFRPVHLCDVNLDLIPRDDGSRPWAVGGVCDGHMSLSPTTWTTPPSWRPPPAPAPVGTPEAEGAAAEAGAGAAGEPAPEEPRTPPGEEGSGESAGAQSPPAAKPRLSIMSELPPQPVEPAWNTVSRRKRAPRAHYSAPGATPQVAITA